jgi:hypothetical protein
MSGQRGRQAEQDGDADAGVASAASFLAAVVTEIYLCNVRSCVKKY